MNAHSIVKSLAKDIKITTLWHELVRDIELTIQDGERRHKANNDEVYIIEWVGNQLSIYDGNQDFRIEVTND